MTARFKISSGVFIRRRMAGAKIQPMSSSTGRADDGEPHGCVQDFLQPREVLAAVCLRNQNADADAHAGKKTDKAVNRPRTGSDRRRCILSEQIADEHEVDGIVHLLNDTGAQQRQRKQQHGTGDGALRQINGFIFHKRQSPF